MPPTVTGENAQAEFENGVLRVTLAKREEAKARKIQISGADQPIETKQINDQAQTANA